MDATFLTEKFESALNFDEYIKTGTDEQHRRWKQVWDAARLNAAQTHLLSGFVRKMHVLVVSGIWCGDCIQQCPLLEKIARANSRRIQVRFLDRDLHKELSGQLQINAGARVPVALFLAEDFELCSIYGERSLSRYRALAVRQLGAACEIAIAPPDQDELAATLSDWLGEFERIQLMLRLSPRLRQRYGD